MHPLLLFLLALVTPAIFACVVLIPPYIGISAAAYAIYYKGGAHPLAGKLGDVSYMIDVYTQLFSHWAQHVGETSILTYALPLLLLPILGIMLTLWLGGKVARKLKDIFQSGVST
jgi:hypothetical protein